MLKDLDAVVCDLDGVIYRGDGAVGNSPAAVRALRERGLKVLFCTNNARPTVATLIEKLGRMGIPCDRDEMINSPTVAGEVIASEHPGARVLVVGGPGIYEAMDEFGLSVVENEDADVVVVGMNPEFTYADMSRASRAIMAGARFYATNDDPTYPAEDGLKPGAGAIVASIATAVGHEPIVLGKPHRPMMESVLRRLPSEARVAMVGDRPGTDLDGARTMGWRTILVLSGVSSEQEAQNLRPQPDLVIRDIGTLAGVQ